jgi:hypothetical protein
MDTRAHQGPVLRRRHVSKGARERRRVWQGTLGLFGALVRTPIKKGSGASLPFCPSLFPARADTLSQSQLRASNSDTHLSSDTPLAGASYLLVQLSFSFAFLWRLRGPTFAPLLRLSSASSQAASRLWAACCSLRGTVVFGAVFHARRRRATVDISLSSFFLLFIFVRESFCERGL